MHFKSNADKLSQAVAMAARALTGKAPRPVYEGIFIETTDTGVRFTCTNGTMTVRASLEAMVEEGGTALLPGKVFYDLVRHSVGEVDVQANMADMSARVQSFGSDTNLVCLPADEFPEVEDVAGGSTVSLKQADFARAISRVNFALGSDESRRILTGCLIEAMPDEVRFVCLDGYRFAMKSLRGQQAQVTDKVSAIAPGQAFVEISRMAQDTEDPVEIIFNRTHLQVNYPFASVYCPLIPGEYINYRQILPQVSSTTCKIARDKLFEAVDRTAVIARLGDNLIRMDVADDRMTVRAAAAQGKSIETVDVILEGQPLSIAFSCTYLQDIVKNLDADEITMGFQTNVSPCLFTPAQGDDFVFLLLPVRTVS